MKRQNVVTILGLAALLFGPSLAHAAVPVPLGSTSTYGVVSSTFSNTGAGTVINGDLCYTTGTFNTQTGTLTVPCPDSVGQDQAIATANLNAQANAVTCTILPEGNLNAIDIGFGVGHFVPGCYTRASAFNIVDGTTVFLDGVGVYIFRSGGALTTGANSIVTMTSLGACETDVNWGLTGEATLGANSQFVGNIFDAAGITMGQNAILTGRALAYGGTVTVGIAPATFTVPLCAPAAVCDIITMEPALLPDGIVGNAYSATLTASGGGAYTYTAGSGLPPGLTLDPATGEISGTPTAAGTFNFTVTGTDGVTLCFGIQDYTIVIAAFAVPGIPTLDWVGMALLIALIAAAGMFLAGRFSA